MKTYEANEELEEVLLSQGFIETTSEHNKRKGKKSFKISKLSKKEIYFDYINIRILNSIHGQDCTIKMTEKELKLLLLYFKLRPTDYEEFDINGKFSFDKNKQRLESIKLELDRLIYHNVNTPRKNKLKRIIEFYDNITLKSQI